MDYRTIEKVFTTASINRHLPTFCALLIPMTEETKIDNKKDLSKFLSVTEKYINIVLHSKDRQSYYNQFEINKASGKPRTIHAVNGALKKLQRKALDKLQAEWRYQPSGYSHGFTIGKSIITNAAHHQRSKCIIKVDLKDFFPSIHFGRVQGMFMAPPFKFGEKAATIMSQMACLNDEKGMLPQGGVLSPYIANMMCRHLDKRLGKQSQKSRCCFTRYADDITFSTNDVKGLNVEKFLEEIYQIIEDENFVVNKEKTKVLTKKDRQIVTGIVVNDGMNLNRKYIRNIRATIFNCEKYGVASQVVRKKFKDQRNSRIALQGDKQPSEKYFLKHLLGKINFFGNVALSNGQDAQHSKEKNKYQRVRTYEELLWRFYKLKEVEKSRDHEIRDEITEATKAAIKKRPRLAERLSARHLGDKVKREVLAKHRGKTTIKNALDKVDRATKREELLSIVEEFQKRDPRFFVMTISQKISEAKDDIKNLLNYPAIDQQKTKELLESLKTEGGLKHLVHKNSEDFSVKNCYEILADNYRAVEYFLPKELKKEIEKWIKALDKILEESGKNAHIDVMSDSRISKETKQLKINTRFGGNSENSTVLKDKLKNKIEEINVKIKKRTKDGVSIQIKEENLIKIFYTHVPSVITSIDLILTSMLSRSKEFDVTTINIESSKDGEFIEIAIFDNSKKPAMESLKDRNFVHGKLTEVIRLTNGLCDYWVELSLFGGSRAALDMHTETLINSKYHKYENGFVHRLRFPNIR